MATSRSSLLLFTVSALAVPIAIAACSGTGTSPSQDAAGSSGSDSNTAGSAGDGGKSGSAGSSGGGAGGSSGSGGSGISGIGGSGIAGDGGSGSIEEDGGGLQDAKPDVDGSEGCVEGGAPKEKGPLPHVCAPKTDNECAGGSDLNPALPNGAYGNGFDDDCDGIVDEGCECGPDNAPGTTKECFLVPSSQADAQTKEPVGWCTQNSRGTTACVQINTGELMKRNWDGFCKGAAQPFADDACSAGDFDCDGLDSNSQTQDCACKEYEVTCPTDPLVISPFPDPSNLEKKKANPFDPKPNEPFIIDGYNWIGNGAGPEATDWVWGVVGGDCDNILPHPTYAIYGSKTATNSTPIGTEIKNSGSNGKQKAIVTKASNTQHQIWPAFSLSGDYSVIGRFKLGGQQYSCTMKVQVRAPGLRAEMCWDMKADDFLGMSSSDLDLHMARLQGSSAQEHGWFNASGTAPTSDDCYWSCDSGCRTGNAGFCTGAAPAPGWGYAPSNGDSCHGWGSLREANQSCDNPRLDRDNLGCNTTVTNPSAPSLMDNPLSNFCGPENINLDNPKPGDQFLVGVHYYSGNKNYPHVNIYCNGERKLAVGSDPTSTPPVTFPTLNKAFNPSNAQFVAGDFWQVARVTWTGDANEPCKIEPVPSREPKLAKDGSSVTCVDTNAQNKSSPTTADKWLFTPSGGYANSSTTDIENVCWH